MAAGDAGPPRRTKSETAAARVDTSVVVAAPASRGDEGRASARGWTSCAATAGGFGSRWFVTRPRFPRAEVEAVIARPCAMLVPRAPQRRDAPC